MKDSYPDTKSTTQEASPPGQNSDLQRGDVLAARYEIQEFLGKGGMASVYRAFDRVSEQTIAIKVLDADRSAGPAWVEQLGRELRNARILQHPNVCRVFDLFESGGLCFLTMEFAPGGTLRKTLTDEADVRPLALRVADARALIDGVAAIHSAGVVHRDIKPENILRASDGRLLVSDFGVALHPDRMTHASRIVGTPSYMAPEVHLGARATQAADVWSLGVVLHELLLGSRPQWEMTPQGHKVLSVVTRTAPARERAFDHLCADCLSQLPAERPPDAAAVKRRFEQAVAGRTRPLRLRLRARVPVLVAAAAVVASVSVVLSTRNRGREPASGTDPHVSLRIIGHGADVMRSSSQIWSGYRMVFNAQLLGDERTLRVFLSTPIEVFDVDLATGRRTPVQMVEEARRGSAMLSPNGKQLLFHRPFPDQRAQVMLSQHPDGRDARALTAGDYPRWHPSGVGFVYRVDPTRIAVFALQGEGKTIVASDLSPMAGVLNFGFDASGTRLGMLSRDVFTDANRFLFDVYAYPSLGHRHRRVLPDGVRAMSLDFNDPRSSWLITFARGRGTELCAVRGDNDCSLLARLEQSDGVWTVSSQIGVVLASQRQTSVTLVRSRADGSQREYLAHGITPADITHSGNALFSLRRDNGDLVVALQRWHDSRPQPVTSGPFDISPSFSADGQSFVYIRFPQSKIVHCRLREASASECRDLWADPLGPAFPRLSPDGKSLAYTTHRGRSERLRVVDLESMAVRDFHSDGGWHLRWSSSASLWTCEYLTGRWREFNAATGRFTGRKFESNAAHLPCFSVPDSVDPGPPGFEVHRTRGHWTELRLARGL